LIERLPGRNRYVLTAKGRRVALFFSKTYARILRPGLSRLDLQAPADATDKLRIAWNRLDGAIEEHIRRAKVAA
jgi:hypothetical protein